MIIIEGADNSGKTILAKTIAGAFGYTYIHSPGPIRNDGELIERLYWYDQILPIKNLILDRCYLISELIYGNIIRKHSRVTKKQMYLYLEKLDKNQGMLLFCDQSFYVANPYPEHTIHLNKKENILLEEKVQEQQVEIRDAYKTLFLYMSKRVRHYISVISIKDFEYIFDYIRRYYERPGF